MRSRTASSSDRGSVWHKSPVGFVVSIILIAVLFVSTLIGISMLNRRLSTDDAQDDLVTFICHPPGDGEAFAIAADVDLTDGMNECEAVIVANALFNSTMDQMALRQLKSVQINDLGIWAVEFSWESATMNAGGTSTENLGHWFRAAIDPFNRTIVYDRCK